MVFGESTSTTYTNSYGETTSAVDSLTDRRRSRSWSSATSCSSSPRSYMNAGLFTGCLDIADGKPVSIGTFFKPRNLGAVFVTALLVALAPWSDRSCASSRASFSRSSLCSPSRSSSTDRCHRSNPSKPASRPPGPTSAPPAVVAGAVRGDAGWPIVVRGGRYRRIAGRRAHPGLHLPQAFRRSGRSAGAARLPAGTSSRWAPARTAVRLVSRLPGPDGAPPGERRSRGTRRSSLAPRRLIC